MVGGGHVCSLPFFLICDVHQFMSKLTAKHVDMESLWVLLLLPSVLPVGGWCCA